MMLGPAEAPIALIRGRFRYRLLVKAPRSADVQSFLRDLMARRRKSAAACACRSTSIRKTSCKLRLSKYFPTITGL